jgi:hypothetical protein
VVVGLLAGLLVGLFAGLVIGLVLGLGFGLFFGLAGGLGIGLLHGVVGGLVGGEIEKKVAPNQGVRRSARTAVWVGLGNGLLYALIMVAGVRLLAGAAPSAGTAGSVLAAPSLPAILLSVLPGGLLYAMVGALAYGGYACLSHLALRLLLWRRGLAPLDYVRFLDYATERIFLQKVGGGYIFVHRFLMEYFAALRQDQDAVRSQTP